ncbi:MAG: N-acetylmuramoyl-L-alanine amidase [Xanthobacteraceae bacterium]|nr:N-acetylmuramoyl-L-alanine amidase [Xanthobacteraceae bacterium]
MRFVVPVLVLVLAASSAGQGLAAGAKSERTRLGSITPGAKALIEGRVVAFDARLAGDELRTRLVVDLNRKIDLTAFTLSDPYRVIVDLPDVTFDLPAAAGRQGRGLISAYRYGLFAPGKARIVLDAKGPVAIDKAFVLEQMDDQPARLVIDLVQTDRQSFIKKAAVEMVTETITAPVPAARKNDRETPLKRDGLPVVVIDPGHGGIDSGAIAPSGEEEAAIVLAVALRLRDRLERSGRFHVVLTRSDDTFIPLAERVKVARSNQAALFVSLHADFMPRHEGDARGATVYTVSDKASDKEAARLAEKENKADLIAGLDLSAQNDDVVGILYDLTHRETKNFSALFARTLVGQLKGAAEMHRTPVKSAGFVVLKAPDVPSVLLELGYLSSPEDVRMLASDAWREKVADAMSAAVQSFFANRVAASGNR